jgi:hypothetical protein
MDRSKLVLVQAFGSEGEADIAKSVLESAGIDAAIQADRAGGMRDHLAWSGFGFELLVREQDAATAYEILQPVPKAPEGKLVVAQICETLRDADIAQGTLESAGIAVAIEAVPVGNKNSSLSLADAIEAAPVADKNSSPSLMDSLFRVLVREEDAVAAREVLKPGEPNP